MRRSRPPASPRAATWPELDVGLPLNPRLAALLIRVQSAERTAVGPQRRPTFRLMRELLTACVRVGVPAQLLADCLGTSLGSVRSRASSPEGLMSAAQIRQLTDLTPRHLDRLSNGALTACGGRRAHAEGVYRTIDVVRALLRTPRTATAEPSSTSEGSDDGLPSPA